jgi:hypothetical protein
MRDLVFDGNPGASTNSGTRTRTPQDNWLARIVLRKEATELKIEGEFTMQITVLNPLACSSRLAPAPLHLHRRARVRTHLSPQHRANAIVRYLLDGIPRGCDSTVNLLRRTRGSLPFAGPVSHATTTALLIYARFRAYERAA